MPTLIENSPLAQLNLITAQEINARSTACLIFPELSKTKANKVRDDLSTSRSAPS